MKNPNTLIAAVALVVTSGIFALSDVSCTAQQRAKDIAQIEKCLSDPRVIHCQAEVFSHIGAETDPVLSADLLYCETLCVEDAGAP